MGIRVYELAREYGISNKDIIKACQKQGIDVKSHMNMLDDNKIKLIKSSLVSVREQKKKESSAASKKEQKTDRSKKSKPKSADSKRSKAPSGKDKKARPAESGDTEKKREAKSKKIIIDFTGSGGFKIPQQSKPKSRQEKKEKKKAVVAEKEEEVTAVDETQVEETVPAEPVELEEVGIELPITVRSLSSAIGIKTNDIIKYLMDQGTLIQLNETMPVDLAQLVAAEYNKDLKIKEEKDLEEEFEGIDSSLIKDAELKPRVPIVTLMGHVDHGKTSLLDYIQKTTVAKHESGGITQHIGAYQVETSHGLVTFLDTPGHEAFTEMRSRGANVTDIVVLVVAADDGVKPQTKEAVSHAKEAGVSIVVALNKIDKSNANPNMVKQQLAGLDLNPEEWGGDTICVEVSAETGQGISDLVEMIALQGEMMELKVRLEGPAMGVVLESEVSEGRGNLARVLVQEGVLKKKDVLLCSHGYGRVRKMINYIGREVKKAEPSTPVEITGLSQTPRAGDKFYVMDNIQKAKQIAEKRSIRIREAALASKTHISLQNLFSKIEEGQVKELKVIVKADVQGSIEVLKKYLNDISTDEVKINIIHNAIGGINESDVLLADASDAIIIGFHVIADLKSRMLAESKSVDIRTYNVIFHLREDITQAMEGLLDPEKKEEETATIEVRDTFKISRIGTIAGCFVRKGKVTRNDSIRVVRDSIVIYDGKIGSLKRFKNDVREVAEGFECGVVVANFNDIKVGDIFNTYIITEHKRTL